MGNRAVITTEDKKIGIYLHWYGSPGYVKAFLTYCRFMEFRLPEHDNYGWARLCQVIANFMGPDGLSVGIGRYEDLDTFNGNNGVYIIKNWRIIGREFSHGDFDDKVNLVDMLKLIDFAQPSICRLGFETIDKLCENELK